jgi:hypothetical protein
MRIIGNTHIALPKLMPSAAALQQAAVHQATAMALMQVATCGVRKGVYRFDSHEAANLASDEAISRAIAMNMRRNTVTPA